MSPVGPQWMSQEEREAMGAGLGAGAPAPGADQAEPKAKKKSKLTAAQINEMLKRAAEAGDAAAAKEALGLGASPNVKQRSKPKLSALELALNAQRGDETPLLILEAGGLRAPQEWGYRPNELNKQFAGYAETGVFTDKKLEGQIKGETLSAFVRLADKWATVARARDLLGRPEKDAELAAWAVKIGRWDLARQAFAAGVGLEGAWEQMEERFASRHADPKSQSDRLDLLAVLKSPEALSAVTAKAAERAYRAAAAHDDAELMEGLLRSGLRPSEDWTVEVDEKWDYHLRSQLERLGGRQRVSLLSLAAGASGGAAFDTLKKAPPAVAAAGRRAEHPWALQEIAVGRLMELKGLGVAVDGLDADGGSVLHMWAKADRAPRAGWATMAKEMPELFGKPDKRGELASEAMAKKLKNAQEVEAFRASLARIESREIRREIPRETAKAKAAPSRSRL